MGLDTTPVSFVLCVSENRPPGLYARHLIEGMNYKSISQSFKDVDTKAGIVTGYLSAFGMVDSDGDIVQRGAFAKTIAENGPAGKKRIKHFQDHDPRMVIGVFQQLSEDTIGLYYESKAGRDTKGRDFLLMAEDGIITEHSIGFSVINRTQGEKDTTILTEIRLWEGSSLQGWGANEYTPITGVKSLSDLLELFAKLEKALKTGTYSDEGFVKIQEKYNQLQDLFSKTTQPVEATVPSEGKDDTAAATVDGKIILDAFKQAFYTNGHTTRN